MSFTIRWNGIRRWRTKRPPEPTAGGRPCPSLCTGCFAPALSKKSSMIGWPGSERFQKPLWWAFVENRTITMTSSRHFNAHPCREQPPNETTRIDFQAVECQRHRGDRGASGGNPDSQGKGNPGVLPGTRHFGVQPPVSPLFSRRGARTVGICLHLLQQRFVRKGNEERISAHAPHRVHEEAWLADRG